MARGNQARRKRRTQRATTRRVERATHLQAVDPRDQLAAMREKLAVEAAEPEATDGAEADVVDLSPARAKLQQVREAFAPRPDCASCDHAYSDHLGTSGPCTYDMNGEECSCKGYVDDGDAEMAIGQLFDPAVGFQNLMSEVAGHVRDRGYVPVDVSVGLDRVLFIGPGGYFAADLRIDGDGEPQLGTFEPTQPTEALVTMRLTDFAFAGKPQIVVGTATGNTTLELGPAYWAAQEAQLPVPTEQPTRDPSKGLRWTATLCPEGKLTDDGRCFAPGSIEWRDLPLTLMAMIETSDEGHNGALVAGRIDQVWRDGSDIRASGVFDNGDYGEMIAKLVGDQTLRGVSVDIAVLEREIGYASDYFDGDGNWAPNDDAAEADLLDVLMGDQQPIMVVTKGVIGASTVCPFPAFADATIALAASLTAAVKADDLWTATGQAGWVVVEDPTLSPSSEGSDGEQAAAATGLTAAAAGLAPAAPPREWFANPNLDELTPLTVTDDGRIFGHAWAWDTCHIGIPDACTTAPRSQTGYAYYLLKEVETEGGERVACGSITLDTGHADRRFGRIQAAAHYDDTGLAVADVVCGEDEHGGWFAGSLRPDVPEEKVRALRGAALSGDWRNVNGNLELVALLAVNVPGFPVPRPRALVASGTVEAVTAVGIPCYVGRAEYEIACHPDGPHEVGSLYLADEPSGGIPADGRAVPREHFVALYDVIGDAYGAGDGETTFNVPDLRGKAAKPEADGVVVAADEMAAFAALAARSKFKALQRRVRV